jgi:hypothetical protein
VLWNVAPARDAFYSLAFHVTDWLGIALIWIISGQLHMRF